MARVTFLILLALLALEVPGLLIIFFVPIVGWYLWRAQDRIAELEKKLAERENSGK
jgi:hypothetical protein